MNDNLPPHPPAARPASPTARPPASAAATPRPPARNRRSSGTIGVSTLITVASLAATTAGWAWIAHTEEAQQSTVADAAVADASAAPVADALPPLLLAPIPTLAPNLPPITRPAPVVRKVPAAQQSAGAASARRSVVAAPALVPTAEPPLRAMNADDAALLVPQPQPQADAPVVVAPQAQIAPAQPAPAPITRTRTSRRRTH